MLVNIASIFQSEQSLQRIQQPMRVPLRDSFAQRFQRRMQQFIHVALEMRG